MHAKPKNKVHHNWEHAREKTKRTRATGDEVQSLWSCVQRNRESLARSKDYPVLDSLELSWEVLDEHYGGLIKRADLERVAHTPFEAVMFHIEMGFYPPPELLLALLDGYDAYREGRGELTLEEVYFGPPRRKGGGHAQRRATRARLIWMMWQMDGYLKDGLTKIKAAELISDQLGGTPTAESIVRMLNADAFTRSMSRGNTPRK